MRVIEAAGINDAYVSGMQLMARYGQRSESRYGDVLVVPQPVTTVYSHPYHRVLFHPQRDANPFFHLIEALWMLAGRNDCELLVYLLPRMAEFSDDGHTFHAPYGHRWRHWHPDHPTEHSYSDQIANVIEILRKNPRDRRCIIQMWDPARDLNRSGKDFPCNTTIKVEIDVIGRLNLYVFNRSNDIILGCYGANMVQMSVLQEYLAAQIGADIGVYEQISTNFHTYTDTWERKWPLVEDPKYATRKVIATPIVSNPETFDEENRYTIDILTQNKVISPILAGVMRNSIFPHIVEPMMWAYGLYKNDEMTHALSAIYEAINRHGRYDWLVAGEEWLTRRLMKRTEGDPR
jgi:thymidylate synthase